MLQEFIVVGRSWKQARLFTREHRLLKEMIIPGVVYALLFLVGMNFFFKSANAVTEWIGETVGLAEWLQQERSEWLSFLFVMNGMMLQLLLVLIYFSWFKYLILIIGSPLFTYVSEKTEVLVDGQEHRFQWKDVRADAVRGVGLALRNAGWQTVYLAALVIITLIPVVGWITPLIALGLECYYFGMSMLDYSLARVGYDRSQSFRFVQAHKGLAIGTGFVFLAMHVLLPFAPVYAIISATLSIQSIKRTA
ncbi:MAG: EI24 domain-containing protein [Bacteroidota bacterium]|jgi:CysZ protein